MSDPRPAFLESTAGAPRWLIPCLALVTGVAVVVGNGNVALALAPALVALLVWAVWTLPLRVTMLALLAASWAIESPSDVFASERIHTPWEMVGRILWGKLNLVVPVSALVITGFDLVALLLFAVVVHRHVKRSTIDREGWVDAPSPIGTFAWLSVAAVLWMSAYGLARGGSFRFVLWQSIKWLYLPIVYAFMRQALRGPEDAKLVGKVVLGVGVFRSLEAIALRLKFPSIILLPHATSHHDSVLFATCLAILGALALEMPGRRSFRLGLLLAPVYLWAMVANNRRLVWTEVALVAAFFWLVTPPRRLKRQLTRLALLSLLPLLAYGRLGWNQQSVLFKPVQIVRSMVDSKRDASTMWRDIENGNLIHTYGQNPVVGSGFGHPMIEKIKLPDVTAAYELEPYVPHNSVLGLWAFGGLVGFALLWMVFPVGLFFTVRAYRWSRTPVERVTALGAGAVQICYLMQGYGDLGFGTWGPVFTVAASYALVGKICIASGAWGPATARPSTLSLVSPGAGAPSTAVWKAPGRSP
jgi:hypothetical protein